MKKDRLENILHKIQSRQPVIMGVLNVTPDSFSEQGRHYNKDIAIKAGLQMIEDGADILDIGGESTRPGAETVSVKEEISRVLPVITALAKEGAVLSIDTYHAQTMRAAIDSGASIINDVTALQAEAESIDVVKSCEAPVCLMHMQGTPEDMQKNPEYGDVVEEVFAFLKHRIDYCESHGVEKDRIWVDPGIGFGKTLEHNLILLRHLDKLSDLGCPVLLGVSRKSFIEKICGPVPPDERLPGTISACLHGWQKGAGIFRVHDVREFKQAMDVWRVIENNH